MPVTSRFIPRNVVQAMPSVTPDERVTTLANGATVNVDFDALAATADPALLGIGASPSPAAKIAVGPYLDAAIFSDQAVTLAAWFAISGGTFVQATSTLVPASTFVNISGLRITGRYARVSLSNASGVLANIQLGVYVRST